MQLPQLQVDKSQKHAFVRLNSQLSGELHDEQLMREIYATDASAYQEMPAAVAIPKDEADLEKLIAFANQYQMGLIPRTAGTSLAGQVVGSGIVVDVSRHFTEILEVNEVDSWVRVQPGVIRNELNQYLKPYGLLFGPETSTQNRAMLGGMLGNNSCGSNSIKYGSVRDHIMEVTALLSDGSKVTFADMDEQSFKQKLDSDTLEGRLYQQILELLDPANNRHMIRKNYPKTAIPRRNTGYALDILMDAGCFDETSEKPFNFSKLIAGSEGTLCLVTEMKLKCLPLPPAISVLQCAHFDTIHDALRAAQIATKFDCYACELIDHHILDGAKRSIAFRDTAFFLEGEPAAILVTELKGNSQEEVLKLTDELAAALKKEKLGYAWPVLQGDDCGKVWELRKAGLGLLSNIPGDTKPVPVIEDTAVAIADLAEYIEKFNQQLKEKFGLACVHYAHAGSGEIHLRPLINLKTQAGKKQFRDVAITIADLVKAYQGSLSGEHGDGRLRGEFLQRMIGKPCYDMVRKVKETWDPGGIFNPGKIIDTPPMNEQLRYEPDQPKRDFNTVFNWSATEGLLGAAEMCNGSGDCRKTHLAGGTMCPSYMATRNEKDTTRARANKLRHVLTHSTDGNPFDDEGLKDVLDLCLSCKGCKSECPSTVDMAKMKAEVQQHDIDRNGLSLRDQMVARYAEINRLIHKVPPIKAVTRRFTKSRWLTGRMNKLTGFHPDRSMPPIPKRPLKQWFEGRKAPNHEGKLGTVLLFNDEFTNFQDVEIGIAAIELMEALGYSVILAPILESGRTWLSKGLIRKAKRIINQNMRILESSLGDEGVLVGLEPSALLTFRDEAIDLVDPNRLEATKAISKRCLMFEEWLAQEIDAGHVNADAFHEAAKQVYLHGHCYQKALTGLSATERILSLPKNYSVNTIPSGCCGMAGSFGYEVEHYDISQQIGELFLLPAIRTLDDNAIIAAPGTSCRHQIKDGAQRKAMHPVQVLRDALKK